MTIVRVYQTDTVFQIGKYLMAYYLSTAAAVSAYGAAGALVVILMWIYFTSGVLLFSASVARAWRDQSVSRRAIDVATPTASTAPAGEIKGPA